MAYKDYMQKYDKISFYDQITKNKINSWFLMIFITIILVGLVYVIAQIYNPASTFMFLIFAIIFALGYSLIGFYNGDKIALASVKAYKADKKRFFKLHNIVEGLSIASGLPKPEIYIMPSNEINAFATGRDPEHAKICVSHGALQYLNQEELEGVLGHELSHIANYDIRFITLVVILIGLISIISEIFLRSLWFSSGDSDNRNGVFLIIGIALAILAPIFANLVQLAISRKREFMADAGAVKLTRNPRGLINALKKIDNFYNHNNKTIINKTTSSMMIASPFSSKSLKTLFSTHPSIKDRIKVLEQMY